MSEWIKLSCAGAWLDSRYSSWCRVGGGWGDSSLPGALADALGRGSTTHLAGRQLLTFSPEYPVNILPNWDVNVRGRTWWGVEVEAAGLEAYCNAVLGQPVVAAEPLTRSTESKTRPNARRQRDEVVRIAEKLWPDGNMPALQKAAIQAVRVEMERQKMPAPSDTTIRRGLNLRS